MDIQELLAQLEGLTDIQARLDQLLADNPQAQKYIAKLYYVPGGSKPPADTTHTLTLGSQLSVERHLMIGIVVKLPYSALVEALLALVGTQA